MSAWYDYPTERPSAALRQYARPSGWSRAAINTANWKAPPSPERNAAIVAYKATHPEASFSAIGRVFDVTRNTVAGVLDRALNGNKRERRSPGGAP